MAIYAKRATVYFDPYLHNALKLKALATSRSMTDLVNQAVRQSLAVLPLKKDRTSRLSAMIR